MSRLSLHTLALAALLALATPVIQAHELGKVQVYATFLKDGTYRIDVPIDPEHLTPGDEGGPAGETRYGPIAGLTPKVDGQFGKLLRTFVDGATIAFDGRPVEPKVEIAPPDPDAPPGRTTLRLHGPIPGGARAFIWKNTMALGSYPLVLQNEGDESSEWKWLEGGAESPPFVLAKAVVPPTRWEVVKRARLHPHPPRGSGPHPRHPSLPGRERPAPSLGPGPSAPGSGGSRIPLVWFGFHGTRALRPRLIPAAPAGST